MTEEQEIILGIYDAFADVAHKLGLRYFAIGGTAIGAVRHNGFIPWDDDIDVAMPIEDYLVFLKEGPRHLPQPLQFVAGGTERYDKNILGKLIDTSTTYVSVPKKDHPETWGGLWIDIMPMGGMPKPGRDRDVVLHRMRANHILNVKRRFPLSDARSLKGKILWFATRPLALLPYDFFSNAWLEEMSKHPFDSSPYVGYTWSQHLEWYTSRAIRSGVKPPNGKWEMFFPKEWFESFDEYPFETSSVPCPKGVHAYLRAQFGDDYMEIPPQSERVVHEGFFDKTRPVSYYLAHPELIWEHFS